MFILSALFISCTEIEEEVASTSFTQRTRNSNQRSYSEAFEIAQHSISMLNGSAKTRGDMHTRKISKDGSRAYVSNRSTRSGVGEEDTLIYVFNFEGNEGFALVSASKSTDGLLAVTEKGFCEPGTTTGIEGFDIFIDMAQKYVANSMTRWHEPIDTMIHLKDTTIYYRSYVGPYVTVCWGQTEPEGELFNNGIAGCTNTAIGQILSYFEYPTSINLTYDNADVNVQNLNWTQMKAHWLSHPLYLCGSDTVTHKAISRFFRQLGKLTESDDSSPYSTSTYSIKIAPAFLSLGYNLPHNYFQNYSATSVRNEINAGHLILMRGETSEHVGHAWVLDGSLDEIAVNYIMERIGDGPWIPMGDPVVTTSHYDHFNWGWYGMNNGYFIQNVFNTSYVYLPDTGNNSAARNYNNDVKYLSVYH